MTECTATTTVSSYELHENQMLMHHLHFTLFPSSTRESDCAINVHTAWLRVHCKNATHISTQLSTTRLSGDLSGWFSPCNI